MAPSSGNAVAANARPAQPQSNPRDNATRGRGGRNRGGRGGGGGRGRGRGRGNAAPRDGGQAQSASGTIQATPNPDVAAASRVNPSFKQTQANGKEVAADSDAEVCFICATPVVHYSITPCNHMTCHICSLRMRALYKTKDCAHCRTQAEYVIFTDDPEKRYDEYSAPDISSTDDNIGVRYTNEDIVGDSVLLLRYNCPDAACDFAALGWQDLHRHVKSVHHKKMCDLCTRNKKVFTHEHELFQDKELEKHMRRGDDRPGAVDQTGFKGHPLCGFCGQRFYDDDKLYEHCRNKHERCFICDRRDSRQPHYFRDYNALERHFRDDHFLCPDKECLEKKFVVFESELDLKAHQLSEHGESLSKDVRRDARVVDMSAFDFRPSYQRQRRADREGRGRGRDPNAETVPATSAPSMRRDELAFQRQMAIHSAQSVTTRNFGSQLSSAQPSAPAQQAPRAAAAAAAAGSSPSANAQPSSSPSSSSAAPDFPLEIPAGTSGAIDVASLSPQDRARLARHRGVIERAQTFLGNDATKMARFRQDVSSYRAGKFTARQFLEALFALFSGTSSNSLGILVRELADLFEDASKADALRKAWQDWRAINEDYPSLPSLSGMRGATTASSGWASAASASPASSSGAASQKHSNRVLRLKSSTRQSLSGGGPSVSSASSSWTAPRAATASRPAPPSSSFPALPSSSSSRPSGGNSGASSSASRPSWVASASQSSAGTRASRPLNGQDAFPALPAAPKPVTSIFGYGRGSVRRDWGMSRDTGFSWSGASGSGQGPSGGAAEGSERDVEDEGSGKKKGKKGKKQVLVQWG